MATPAVLVVDDEDYMTDMLASALRIEGYTVHVAYNGREGLASVQAHSIDLMIIDIMMPYLSGIALAEEVRHLEGGREVPIILISAGARPSSPAHGVTFVPKPFDLDMLLDMVAEKTSDKRANDGR